MSDSTSLEGKDEKVKEIANESTSILATTRDSNSNSLEDIEKNIIEDKPIIIAPPKNFDFKINRFGHTWVYWFKDGEPVITIGPHCKITL